MVTGAGTGLGLAISRRFARLHEHRGPACGFGGDNALGSTPQPNSPVAGDWDDLHPVPGDGTDWPEFFLERRLRFQVRLAERNGHGNALAHLLDRAEPVILGLVEAAPESPSLLHGDLWNGNFMTDDVGQPCLIDPAVYYGHREADLAMTRLFGGFAPAFYAAYAEALPLAPGHADRLPLYQLYQPPEPVRWKLLRAKRAHPAPLCALNESDERNEEQTE